MILVITHRTDFTADFVVNKLNQRNIPYKRLNCEDIFQEDYRLNFTPDFQYSIKNCSEFRSVWFRRTKLPEIESASNQEKWYLLNEADSFIKNIFAVLDAEWLSDPFYVYKAENKILQLKTAQRLGFEIPRTLLTSSRTELSAFYHDNNNKIIAKPLSQTHIPHGDSANFIYTNLVNDDLINNLSYFDLTPALYQQYVEKDYELRVTVVGDRVFAAKIDSQKDPETTIDWRRKRLGFEKTDLPEPINQLCISLVRIMGLKFGAIDLIKTPEGQYVFLEINPNGQWAWIESETCLPISDAIIDLLL